MTKRSPDKLRCIRFIRITLLIVTTAVFACMGLAFTCVAACDKPLHGNQSELPQRWKLIWRDEFSDEKLDETKWSLCQRGEVDWNDTMSDDPRLLLIDNGILHLRGIVNDGQDKEQVPYLTAGITSRGKFSFQHGKIRVRAKFNSAQGAWPALWMMGEKGKWPSNGEIDLMEHLNFDGFIYQTIHSEYTHRIDQADTPPKSAITKIDREAWNTYGCEWDADKIVFTVNGKPTHTYPRVPGLGEKQWPFDQPFYFIFSMQIGGQWVNKDGPTNPADFPADLQIAWVRVYQKIADMSTH